MKTRSVSISHYKSKEILEEWLACQWFFHVAFSLKFLSSLARAGLWNYAELWKSYLTLWVDDQGEGSITKFSVIFSKKNSGHHGPSLYEGVFGPSLTSLFDVSKPLPLFIIDIYTLRSVLRHDSRQFLHLCDLDNYLVGSLGFWWCHFCTGSMVTWTMQARCRVHVPIHMSYVAVLHDDNWCG